MGTTVYERAAPAPEVVRHALAGAQARAFWLDDVVIERHPTLESRVEADLVVVGGGYTGLWTAIKAKERDPERSVVLLEAQRVGWAASGRNGGFCEASLTHGEENGRRRWPEEYDTLDHLGLENLDAIESTLERYAMKVDAERTGLLKVAVEEHEVPWLRERSHHDGATYLDREAVQAEIASPRYLAGCWERDTNLLIHPAKLVAELGRVATDLGVEIFEHAAVEALTTTADRVRLSTAVTEVSARQVVLATNVFPSLLRRNRLMTVPVYDYVLATEPLSEAQLRSIGWSNRQGVSDLANQFHYYRPTTDGRIVFGGYDAVYHTGRRVRARYEDRPATFERLASHFFTLFPQLEGTRFSHRWSGAIDTCTQFCAFFGTARRGKIAYAAGFTGLGVAATHFAADVMLDLLAGEPTRRTSLEMVRKRPLPFPPEPLASAGINLARWSMDRADHNQGRRNLVLRAMDAVGLGFDS
ncbi:NAD(P)/FAD-dependent oxidoreductase [Pimelobacter simplex]|uniref:NAD(P)/FAD-dependent oxidoreductase n=1 Tax=Nocardioides simplex TaxID=2045 RepID=UPI0019348D1B|nr:FAD-dependent oxidoreductase [Pimelobacter simplex]